MNSRFNRRDNEKMYDALFRGKRKDNGEWVEGLLKIHLVDGDLTQKQKEYYITVQWMDEIGKVYRVDYEVIPETVGQWTGLTDKNGFKIFEGDIIKDKWNGLGIIEYSENNGCWLSIPCEDGLYQCFKDGDISESDCSNFNVLISQGEIIGNIHDNPELIESTLSREEQNEM